MAHIWACPPSEGDDYIFHCHPPEQIIPKPKRLQEWYKKMLDKGIMDRIVMDYKVRFFFFLIFIVFNLKKSGLIDMCLESIWILQIVFIILWVFFFFFNVMCEIIKKFKLFTVRNYTINIVKNSRPYPVGWS